MRPRDTLFIYIHVACGTLAQALAMGFMGAYLIRIGFGIPAAIATGGAALAVRFAMRSLALPLARAGGYRGAWVVGTLVMASQYAFLPHAGSPWGLAAWMAAHAMGEALYWPYLHAGLTCAPTDGRRGRQLGILSAVISAASVARGLWRAASCSSSPTLRGTLPWRPPSWWGRPSRCSPWGRSPRDRCRASGSPSVRFPLLPLLAFAGDGWFWGTSMYAWGIVLFLSLREDYASFGVASAAAGLLGAVVALAAGRGVDAGKRRTVLAVVVVSMALCTVLRSAATWFPSTAVATNLAGTVALCFYSPVLMSMLYDMARRSGHAYRFHFATEGFFDLGGTLGCLCSAGVAAAFPAMLSLACAPGILGISLVAACIARGAGVTVPGEHVARDA